MEKERIYLFDNIKALLILLVVLGHLLESFPKAPGAGALYMVIYSFHMPLFVFCSGYFADFQPEKTLKCLVYPFVVFQLLYLAFNRFLLGGDAAFTFTKPYWLLWYLFALIVWKTLLPFFAPGRRVLLPAAAAAGIGILAGFDPKIGYAMSLSRIIVYFPFFLAAWRLRQSGSLRPLLQILRRTPVRLACAAAAFCMSAGIVLFQDTLKKVWFLGSYSYQASGSGPLFRLFLYAAAAIWLALLLGVMPLNEQVWTRIGQNSMYVYLLHGFAVKLLQKYGLFSLTEYKIPAALLSAVLLTAVLSRNFIKRLCGPLTRLP